MEEALIARVRADTGIGAVAGSFGGRPAIDLHERKSNERSAFPAAVVSIIAPGRSYGQDGPDPVRLRRVRFECFGLSAGDAILLGRAITEMIEQNARVDGVRFGRGQLLFERSFPPEDIAELRVFRTLYDFRIPTNR